jgi:hypothetical protein
MRASVTALRNLRPVLLTDPILHLLVTRREAARLIGVGERQFDRLCEACRPSLQPIRLHPSAREKFFDRAAVEFFAAERQARPIKAARHRVDRSEEP